MIQRAFFLAWLIYAITATAIRAGDPPTLAEYHQAVADARALVERARAEPVAAQRQPWLEQAAARLGAFSYFQSTPDERLTINNLALIADLHTAASSPDQIDRIEHLVARLRALENALAHPPTAASARDRVTLRDILSRPPFAKSIENPLDQVWNQIAEWLDRLLSGAIRGIVNSRDALVILGLIVMTGAILYFVRNVLINLTPEAEMPPVAANDLPRTSSEARAHAQAFANQGDYRAATRQLYLATLLLLDERDILRYDRALTNREYLNGVQHAPRLSSALTPVIETFDRTWYGFETMNRAEYESYQHQVETLRNVE